MSTYYELEIKGCTVISATFDIEDNSLDDEFGTQKHHDWEMESFTVTHYIDGTNEVDITKSLSENDSSYLKERLMDSFLNSSASEEAS